MTPGFGGDEPSEIIDAGQWLALADVASKSVPATPPARPEERHRHFHAMQNAVFALEEVLKFIPSGEQFVPDSAIWTAEGQAIRVREPGRFRRLRLEAVLKAYRGILEQLR